MNKILLLILLVPFFNFSQTPCVSNIAAGFPCNDYDLMDHFDKSTLSNRDGSDIWGWTDPLDSKEYALMTFEDKTCFLDITDPVNPIYLGFLNTNAGSNLWRDVKVYQNHAFIVADFAGNHGMQVFDLTRLRNVSNPPENFTADTVLTAGFGGSTIRSCHNIVINESKAIAYLVGCRSANGGGPIMIDISNPTNPVAVGQYTADGYTHDAQVVTYDGPDNDYNAASGTPKEIFIGSNENKVVIVDVTDPTAPVKISDVTYSSTGYTHQGWFNSNKNYFLVGDEYDEQDFGNNTRTIIFDFSDLDNPVYHSQFLNTTGAIDHNLYVKDDIMYQANYRSGLRVLNIADINNITEIGYFDTYPQNDAAAFNGAWSVYPYFSSGNIIISDIDRGFFVVRKSGTLNVEQEILVNSDIAVYPNPASSTLKMTSKENKIHTVGLYSLLGQKIVEQKHDSLSELTLDVSRISEGFYFVKINNSYTKKIVIKR